MLIVLMEKPAWHWYWVASLSIGTYLLYVDGPYWPIVIVGWIGWVVLGLYYHREKPAQWLQFVQATRAKSKVQHIEALLRPEEKKMRILDLGAGEGYVGAAIAERWDADVQLVDVCDMNKTRLPHTLYDGENLPFPDQHFDLTILYFVLHHSEQPEKVMREALRVTKSNLVIVESVFEAQWDLKLLTTLDVAANRLRSGGLMNPQEEHLHFRKAPAWKALIQELGGNVVVEHRKGEWIHKQHTFVVEPPGSLSG